MDYVKNSEVDFYLKAAHYWAKIPPTVNGMLGGFSEISKTDLCGSRNFLFQLFRTRKNPPGRTRALDCGAGIGRVTKHLLAPIFQKVDLVEQDKTFLEKAEINLQLFNDRIGSFLNVGLQNFKPQPNIYDVIWIQWVSGHLTDSDFIKFLKECRNGLKPNGIIVLKENVASSDEIEYDKIDSSVTRPLSLVLNLIKKSGYKCIRHFKQTNFPETLYKVYMIAIVPEIEQDNVNTN